MIVVIEQQKDNQAFWDVYGPFEGHDECSRAHDFIRTRCGPDVIHSVAEVIQTLPLRSAPAIETEEDVI